jgi:geranylgeranyl diphosphate synthase type I
MNPPPPHRRKARSPSAATDFASSFESFRERLDVELVSWLERKHDAVAGYAPDAVELVDALEALVTAGGKRLRPALVYHAYRGCGGADPAPAMSVALAVEFLHTYLLIHDDIMDHADVRRGLPAAHVRFGQLHRDHGWHGEADDYGEAAAILVGDLSHAYAVEAFSQALTATPRSEQLRRVFFSMSEEVIAGQHLEMRVAMSRVAGERELARVLRLKSGAYSVERPVELGAILAGAGDAELSKLRRYGSAVGEAFQLQDDILGVFGDLETVGKPVGGDVSEGKFTFLIFHTLRLATPEQGAIVERSLGKPDPSPGEIEAVREIIRGCGALDQVREMIEQRLDAAREALGEMELRAEGWTFLEGLIGFLRERRR